MQEEKNSFLSSLSLFLDISAVQVPLGFPLCQATKTPLLPFLMKKMFLGDENKVIGLADNYKLAARQILRNQLMTECRLTSSVKIDFL